MEIQARSGAKRLVPFVYIFIASIASCVVVAATTVLFSEEKTKEWLLSVFLCELWRNCVLDPFRAVSLGGVFEVIFGCILGGCLIEDQLSDLMEGDVFEEFEGEGEVSGGEGEFDIGGDEDVEFAGGEGEAVPGAEMGDDNDLEDLADVLSGGDEDVEFVGGQGEAVPGAEIGQENNLADELEGIIGGGDEEAGMDGKPVAGAEMGQENDLAEAVATAEATINSPSASGQGIDLVATLGEEVGEEMDELAREAAIDGGEGVGHNVADHQRAFVDLEEH